MDPNAQYYRGPDEPEEVITADFDNGYWEYRSDNLGIFIHRITAELDDGDPLVYYVAQIRMRNYSSYRTGLRTATRPWKYGRLEQAVLCITGDNLTEMEKELKGCLIRKGRFYSDYNKTETLVIGQNLDLYVLSADEFTAQQLLDSGVRDTYSFGPVLIYDSVINENANEHRVGRANPRCGIGMVEPGYWIAIVSDGRQSGYSMSIDLATFAQLFADRGCTVAYNLDGGSSAAMVFMGETLNKHEGKGTADVMRSWTDALMWGYSTQLPSPDENTQNDGYHH